MREKKGFVFLKETIIFTIFELVYHLFGIGNDIYKQHKLSLPFQFQLGGHFHLCELDLIVKHTSIE